uniref:Cytochrome n=1 Tax=Lutzomyia longipalpis TaxID=7200 RepID=A0A1B0CSB4_LUTLO
MSLELVLICVIFSVIGAIVWHDKFSRQATLGARIRGPSTYPLIGNGNLFVGASPPEILQVIGKLVKEYGKVLRVFLGLDFMLFVTDPKFVEHKLHAICLVDNLELSKMYDLIGQVVFFVLPILIFFVISDYQKKKNTLKGSKIRGPPVLPIVGNGLLFFGKSPPEILKTAENLMQTYGKLARVWIGNTLNVMLCDPKYVEVLLSSNTLIDKSKEYTFLRNWLGDGLLLTTGKKWQSRRKIITPTFHFKILEQFVEVFDKQGNTFVNVLKKMKPEEGVDIYPLVTLYALDVICDSAMGTTANAQLNSNSEYVQANRNGHVVDDGLGIKKKMAFLDVLLQATVDGKPLNNMDIREEVDTFMFEGHDTTTSGISFLLYNIALHSDVQRRVVEEIRDVFGTDTRIPTISDLNNLQYLDLVIKETMRLYPSVPIIGRQSEKEVTINDITIPAGAGIAIGTYFMGRDPDLFTDPETFNPERFAVERSGDTQNLFGYVPFSAGPRNCIGKKWQSRRKIITPTFHFKILEQFVEVFDKQGNTFVNVLKKMNPEESVDIYPLVTLYALDVICDSAMGTTANAQLNSNSEYVQAVKDITNVLHLRMFDFLLRPEPFFKLSRSATREKKAIKVLHDFTDRVIVARRNDLYATKRKTR